MRVQSEPRGVVAHNSRPSRIHSPWVVSQQQGCKQRTGVQPSTHLWWWWTAPLVFAVTQSVYRTPIPLRAPPHTASGGDQDLPQPSPQQSKARRRPPSSHAEGRRGDKSPNALLTIVQNTMRQACAGARSGTLRHRDRRIGGTTPRMAAHSTPQQRVGHVRHRCMPSSRVYAWPICCA